MSFQSQNTFRSFRMYIENRWRKACDLALSTAVHVSLVFFLCLDSAEKFARLYVDFMRSRRSCSPLKPSDYNIIFLRVSIMELLRLMTVGKCLRCEFSACDDLIYIDCDIFGCINGDGIYAKTLYFNT